MTVSLTLLREVLLGRATWRDLAAAGTEIRSVADGWSFGRIANDPLVVLEADLRQGILTQMHAPDRGREWAAFLLSAADLFDLGQLSNSRVSTAEQVLEALWDLSAGEVDAARQRLEA